MTLARALAIYDADPEAARVDEAVEYAGQIPDNVRHLRLQVARMIQQWHDDNGGDDD